MSWINAIQLDCCVSLGSLPALCFMLCLCNSIMYCNSVLISEQTGLVLKPIDLKNQINHRKERAGVTITIAIMQGKVRQYKQESQVDVQWKERRVRTSIYSLFPPCFVGLYGRVEKFELSIREREGGETAQGRERESEKEVSKHAIWWDERRKG